MIEQQKKDVQQEIDKLQSSWPEIKIMRKKFNDYKTKIRGEN